MIKKLLLSLGLMASLGMGQVVVTPQGGTITINGVSCTLGGSCTLPTGSGAMTQLAQTILLSPASTITFSSIPATYTDLVLTLSGRTSNAVNVQNVSLQFNGDTGANYSWIYTSQNSSTGSFVAQNQIVPAFLTGANGTVNLSGSFRLYIYNYAGTTFVKQITSTNPSRYSTTANTSENALFSGDWNSTAAITSIVLGLTAAGNFVTGTTATLWGIK